MGKRLGRLRSWAAALKRDVVAIWIAARSSGTPLVAQVAAGAVAAYALSPIDLIPDFIPVLGYLDDLLLVPLGIAIVIRLIPPELMALFRSEADRRSQRPTSRAAAFVIVALWVLCLIALGWTWMRVG